MINYLYNVNKYRILSLLKYDIITHFVLEI